MTERRSFYRKLAYLGGIVALLFPLAMLGAPQSRKSPGGKISEMRVEDGLAQANLGEIDPASEMFKLATLGMRGIAVNLLWNKAHEYKKTENWTELTATLDQLAKLQPNFISFWKFQAWNVTYNVSVEFDDYHDRYYYVIKGIDFLKKGEKYNQYNPKLLWDLGWFIGQKIGRADEHVEYRRLFKADDDFHPEDRPLEDRDNWRVAKTWYDQSVEAVDTIGRSLGKTSPVVFYSSPAMALMNYADAIETEGTFGGRAREAWKNAEEAWRKFGQHAISHSTGVMLRLGDEERLAEQVQKLTDELDAIVPGARDELLAERRESITPEELKAFETPLAERTREQQEMAAKVAGDLQVTGRDIASRIAEKSPENEKRALQLVRDIERAVLRLRYTRNYKQTANYDYWKARAEFEQTDDALNARESIFQAGQAFEVNDFNTAREKYLAGFKLWRNVLDAFPLIAEDSTNGEELIEVIKKYREVLDQLDEKLGDDFPLWDVIEQHDMSGDFAEELKARGKSDSAETRPDAAKTTGETPNDAANDATSEAEKPETSGDEPAEDSGATETDAEKSSDAEAESANAAEALTETAADDAAPPDAANSHTEEE